MRMRNKVAAIAAVAVSIVAVPAIATGVIIDLTEPTYTGCLKPGGGLYRFAAGSEPKVACEPGETKVRLSGGDITAVTAGTGLAGGGDSGPVTVNIATPYRLPQGCAVGRYPVMQAGGTWGCGTDIGRIQATIPSVSAVVTGYQDSGCRTYGDEFLPGPKTATNDNDEVAITLPGGVYRVLPHADMKWSIDRTKEYGNESTFVGGWAKVEVVRRLQGIDMPVATWTRVVDEHLDNDYGNDVPAMNQDFGTFSTAGGAQFFTRITVSADMCARARVLYAKLDLQRVG